MIRANLTNVFEDETFNGQSATLSAQLTHQNLGQEFPLLLRTDGQRMKVSSVQVGRGFVLRLVQKDTSQTYTQYEPPSTDWRRSAACTGTASSASTSGRVTIGNWGTSSRTLC